MGWPNKSLAIFGNTLATVCTTGSGEIGSSYIVSAIIKGHACYSWKMTEDERIQRHLDLCQRVFERLVAEGKWAQPDSQKSADLLESEELQTDL